MNTSTLPEVKTISEIQVKDKLTHSLLIYEIPIDSFTRLSEQTDLTWRDCFEMYYDALCYWLNFQRQFISREKYELAAKIKHLLDLEQMDCVNILNSMVETQEKINKNVESVFSMRKKLEKFYLVDNHYDPDDLVIKFLPIY